MCRNIASAPGARFFKPRGVPLRDTIITTLEIDEFEALRLADLEGLYQSDAAQCMGVSRQTFGLIIKAARRKVAEAVCQGHALAISTEVNFGGLHENCSTCSGE